MTALEVKRRFQLPTDWSPVGTRCVVFTIPDDPEYFSQIIGLVDALKFSNNFGRDPTRTGAATVSRAWQAALESQPVFTLEDCEGGEMAFIKIRHRPKPGQPWVTQEKYDDEPETAWRDAHIQPHWGEAITPVSSNPHERWEQIGRVVRGFNEWMPGQFITGLAAGETKTQTVNGVMGQLAPYVGGQGAAIRQAVEQAYDMIADLPTPTAEPYAEDCAWMADANDILEFSDAVPEWAQSLTQKAADLAQTAADEINKAFWNVASKFTSSNFWQAAMNNSPGGGGAGFGDICEWTEVLDFSISDYGFEGCCGNPTYQCPDAVWESGVGFRQGGACEDPPGNSTVEVIVRRTLPASAKIKTVAFEPVFSIPSATESYGINIGDVPCAHVQVETGGVGYDVDDFPGCVLETKIKLFALNTVFSDVHIVEVTISGTGFNPFV